LHCCGNSTNIYLLVFLLIQTFYLLAGCSFPSLLCCYGFSLIISRPTERTGHSRSCGIQRDTCHGTGLYVDIRIRKYSSSYTVRWVATLRYANAADREPPECQGDLTRCCSSSPPPPICKHIFSSNLFVISFAAPSRRGDDDSRIFRRRAAHRRSDLGHQINNGTRRLDPPFFFLIGDRVEFYIEPVYYRCRIYRLHIRTQHSRRALYLARSPFLLVFAVHSTARLL